MKVLIAVEDKLFGDAIADFICNREDWEESVEFRVIHVVEPLHPPAFTCLRQDVMESYSEERHRAGKAFVLSVGTELRRRYPHAAITEQVLDGIPKEIIVQTAKEWNADLIIVGSHGRAGISQFLLGSVSMSVLSASTCSVMIVKLPAQQTKKNEQAKDTALSQN